MKDRQSQLRAGVLWAQDVAKTTPKGTYCFFYLEAFRAAFRAALDNKAERERHGITDPTAVSALRAALARHGLDFVALTEIAS